MRRIHQNLNKSSCRCFIPYIVKVFDVYRLRIITECFLSAVDICWRPTHITFLDIFWCCWVMLMRDCKCNAGRDSAVAGLTWLWTLNILRVSVYGTQVRNIQHFHTCGNIIQLNKSRIIVIWISVVIDFYFEMNFLWFHLILFVLLYWMNKWVKILWSKRTHCVYY